MTCLIAIAWQTETGVAMLLATNQKQDWKQ